MDISSISVGFVVGIATGFIANYITPKATTFINKIISSLFNMLNPDRYDLTGTWVQTFKEPDDNGSSEWVDETEQVRLSHLGNIVTGSGVTKSAPRTFIYDLKAKHNMVFGSYVKKCEQGSITGVGMIQLMVSPDRLKMTGQATWFDSDTSQIESSASAWLKTS